MKTNFLTLHHYHLCYTELIDIFCVKKSKIFKNRLSNLTFFCSKFLQKSFISNQLFFYSDTIKVKMSKLKIAIQKSGRLYEDSLQLLKDCGIFVNNGKDQLKVSVDNFPMEIMYLRNSDIPQYLEDGVVDIAIVGENLLIEK